MKNRLLVFAGIIIVVLIFCVGHVIMEQSQTLQKKQTELSLANAQIDSLLARERAHQSGKAALEELAQSCLDRENAARQEADEWRLIMEQMEMRPLTPKEEKEAPDEKTRAALLDSLDQPL